VAAIQLASRVIYSNIFVIFGKAFKFPQPMFVVFQGKREAILILKFTLLLSLLVCLSLGTSQHFHKNYAVMY